MTRIIAGAAGGRRLQVPPRGTRPTSDRAREAVFSSVESLLGSLSDTSVIDLYAGSGAMGLEALSRGARRVELIEENAKACAVVEQNIAAVALVGATCHQSSVRSWLARAPEARAHLVLCDPPYDLPHDQLHDVLELVVRNGHVVDGGIVVVERSRRDSPLNWPVSLAAVKNRRYGEAELWFGRRVADL